MARKLPESEQVEELPPQGIWVPESSKQQWLDDPKVNRFLHESSSWDTVDSDKIGFTVKYHLHRAAHEKHMMDSLMWEIHQALRRADYPKEIGISIDVTLWLGKSSPDMESSEIHLCDELQGVEHED